MEFKITIISNMHIGLKDWKTFTFSDHGINLSSLKFAPTPLVGPKSHVEDRLLEAPWTDYIRSCKIKTMCEKWACKVSRFDIYLGCWCCRCWRSAVQQGVRAALLTTQQKKKFQERVANWKIWERHFCSKNTNMTMVDILSLIITVHIVLIILWNFILKGQMETQYGKQMCPLGPLTFCPYKDRPSADFIFIWRSATILCRFFI